MVESKKDKIAKRAIEHGLMFIRRNATIRSVAKASGTSKSTVFLDLKRLEEIHPYLYKKVREKLDFNISVRSIRGGASNKEKWERKNNK